MRKKSQEAGYAQHLLTPGIHKLLHFNAPQKHSKTTSNKPLLSDGYYARQPTAQSLTLLLFGPSLAHPDA